MLSNLAETLHSERKFKKNKWLAKVSNSKTKNLAQPLQDSPLKSCQPHKKNKKNNQHKNARSIG